MDCIEFSERQRGSEVAVGDMRSREVSLPARDWKEMLDWHRQRDRVVKIH